MIRSRLVPLFALALAAAAGLAHSASAEDSVDLELVGDFAGKGTIRPADERERFLIPLAMGTKLTAVAKARSRKGAFAPQIDLVDGMDGVVGSGTLKGKKSTLRAGPLEAGGDYRLRVFGDGAADGDYTVSLKLKPQRSFKGGGSSAPGSFSLVYRFGAPAGTRAKILLKPATKASTFVPALEALVSPTGASIPITGDRTGLITLDESGDWTVGFHDGGPDGGDWTCQVTLKLPRSKKAKFDISAGKLTGDFVDQQPVYGRVVAPSDLDTLIDPDDNGGPLDGASVLIPAGGAPFPVVITMNETSPIPPGPGEYPAGPAVQFGPSGLNFADGKMATITIAYDPSQFVDPETELTIYVLDEGTGEVVAVPKPYEFPENGVVSFPSPHFSAYMAAAPRQRSLRGDWVTASLRGSIEPDFRGSFEANVGPLTIYDGDGTYYDMYSSGLRSTWVRDPLSELGGPDAFTDPTNDYESGSIYEEAENFYSFYSQDVSYVVRSAGGDLLAAVRNPFDEGLQQPELSFALRRARGSPTPTNVAGRWHLFAIGAMGQFDGGDPPSVRLRTEVGRGTLTFGTNGKVSVVLAPDIETETDYPDGAWRPKSSRATMTAPFVASYGEVQIYFTDSGSPPPLNEVGGLPDLGPVVTEVGGLPNVEPLRLLPCLNGDVLMGAFSDSGNDDPLLIVLVRERSGYSKKLLTGPTGMLGYQFIHTDAEGEGDAQRLGFLTRLGTVSHDGTGGLLSTLAPFEFGHDVSGTPQAILSEPLTDQGTYSISKNGLYSASTGFAGAYINASGGFLIGTNPADGSFFFGAPGLNLAPDFGQILR